MENTAQLCKTSMCFMAEY